MKWRTPAVLEICFFGGLMPMALLWLVPPSLHAMVFPTLVIWPLLLGLRYGFLAGSLVAIMTTSVLAATVFLLPKGVSEFPSVQAIVLLLAGMSSGEVRDSWDERVRRLTKLEQYHRTRLEEFSSAYQLLKISHGQIERRLGEGRDSLRATLQRLKEHAQDFDASAKLAMGGAGPWMLEILAELGNLHTAGLYQVNKRGVLQTPALATMGVAPELSAFNPMLRETLRSGSLTTVLAAADIPHEPVIAIVPLVDATGRIHGVVSITEMLFVSIQAHTFQVLGIAGKHMGDILGGKAHRVAGVQEWAIFKDSLQRNQAHTDSVVFPVALLACHVIDASRRYALVAHCCNGSRGLDECWVLASWTDAPVVVKIMPLTDENGVGSYLARLKCDAPDVGFGINSHYWMLGNSRTTEDLLDALCTACALEKADLQAPPGNLPATGDAE